MLTPVDESADDHLRRRRIDHASDRVELVSVNIIVGRSVEVAILDVDAGSSVITEAGLLICLAIAIGVAKKNYSSAIFQSAEFRVHIALFIYCDVSRTGNSFRIDCAAESLRQHESRGRIHERTFLHRYLLFARRSKAG